MCMRDRYFQQSQIKIIKSENFFQNSDQVLAELEEYFGLETYEDYNFRPQNVGNYQSKVNESTLQWLKNYYQPHNKRLSALVADSISWE